MSRMLEALRQLESRTESFAPRAPEEPPDAAPHAQEQEPAASPELRLEPAAAPQTIEAQPEAAPRAVSPRLMATVVMGEEDLADSPEPHPSDLVSPRADAPECGLADPDASEFQAGGSNPIAVESDPAAPDSVESNLTSPNSTEPEPIRLEAAETEPREFANAELAPPAAEKSAPEFAGLAALLGRPSSRAEAGAGPFLSSTTIERLTDRPGEPGEPPPAAPEESLDLGEAALVDQIRTLAQSLAEEFAATIPAAILLLGVDAGDHSSSIAALLGAELARRGEGTVLIDAAFAAHRVSSAFGMEDRCGLSEALTRDLAPDVAVVHATSQPGLAVVPTGREVVLGHPELGTRAAMLLSQAASGRRWMIVDGGAPDSAVAKTLAQVCDGAYLVVRLGQTAPSDAAQALAALRAAGADVRGCIATNAPL